MFLWDFCVFMSMCFLCFFFGCIFCFFVLSYLVCFYFIFEDAYLFSNEKEKWRVWMVRWGIFWKKLGVTKTLIRIYCMKKICIQWGKKIPTLLNVCEKVFSWSRQRWKDVLIYQTHERPVRKEYKYEPTDSGRGALSPGLVRSTSLFFTNVLVPLT